MFMHLPVIASAAKQSRLWIYWIASLRSYVDEGLHVYALILLIKTAPFYFIV